MSRRFPVPVAAAFALLAVLATGPARAADGTSASTGKGGTLGGVSAPLERAVEAAERTRRSVGGTSTKPDAPRADVVLDTDAGPTRAHLAAAGVKVIAHSARYGRATVTVPDRAALERLAALPGVRMVRSDYGYRRRDGDVTSRGVEAMEVDGVGGLDGTGITVGILSDSFARTSGVRDSDTTPDACVSGTLTGSNPQETGDLPASVEILADDASGGDSCPDTGTLNPGPLVDEGAAMAELIHDVAPNAEIVFHTAVKGIGQFADAIDTLCSSGADVIVDDIGFLAELMYQRDVISAAAEDCVERGVAFFSAAGNGGDRAFRARFDDLLARDDEGREAVFPPTERDFHNWAGGDPYLKVEVPANSRLTAVLQWNQPALFSVPANTEHGPRIDLDLLSFASPSTTSVETGLSSVRNQKAGDPGSGQDPFEIVEINTDSSRETHYLAIDHWAGEQETIPQGNGTPLEFRLVFFESGSSSTIEYLDTSGGPDAAPSMYGHTVASGVQSVGAVPWFDAGPFLDDKNDGPTNRIDPESFTARGDALERHFRPDGSFRRGTQHPQPRIAASDFNNTTFFGRQWNKFSGLEAEDGEDDGFPNFAGTSAAAPQAAAVAALLLEDDGALAPADIAAKLQASATDVRGEDAATGCDDRTGSGLVNAAAAVTAGDRPPRADAGSDRKGKSGDTITLDGSASRDNNEVDGYRWRQVAGRPVDLSNPSGAQTDLTIPNASANLAFELRVTDASCLSDADRVTVKVKGGGGGGGALGGGLAVLLALYLAGRRQGRPRAL